MTNKKKLTKGDKKVLQKVFGEGQDMVIKIDKKENLVTIITPLVRIRKAGCKSITLKEGSKDQELTEEKDEHDVACRHCGVMHLKANIFTCSECGGEACSVCMDEGICPECNEGVGTEEETGKDT